MTNNTASGRHGGPADAVPHSLSRRGFLATGGLTMAALGASPLLAACSSSSGGSPPSGPSNALTVGAFQEPDTLDPNATGLALSLFIASQIYDPLMWWLPTSSGGYEFVPGLAQSYEVSSDGTTFTFHLRKGVTFHDGTAFDATAVKATFDHIVDPATKSRSAIGSLGPYQETKVLDQYTAQVVFKAPNAAFAHEMGTLLFGMTSPAALKKYGPTGIGNNPVGTGPFKFVSYTPQNQVALERNPAYQWGPSTFGAPGPAKLKTLTFKILADTNARYNALLAGQIQMAMNLDPNDIASIEKNSGFRHLNVPSTGQPYGYPINVSKAPTDELEVRQAILHAVNQDQLIKTILDGVYQPAHNLLTPTTPGYSQSASGLYPYSPAKAESLLESAGWKGRQRRSPSEERPAIAPGHADPVGQRFRLADPVHRDRAEQRRLLDGHLLPAVPDRGRVVQQGRPEPGGHLLLRRGPLFPAQPDRVQLDPVRLQLGALLPAQ